MPKKKTVNPTDRLKKYEGMSQDKLKDLRKELATQMPADDDPEVFTAFFDVSSLIQ